MNYQKELDELLTNVSSLNNSVKPTLLLHACCGPCSSYVLEYLYQFFDIQSCRNHIHLSCKKCGKIFHMENQVADSFINEISESQGFNISKAETTLYGLCAQCK